MKPVPVMVITVPPLIEPALGVIEVTLGAGSGEGGRVVVELVPPQLDNNRVASSNRSAREK
jgi:hypothetical protein